MSSAKIAVLFLLPFLPLALIAPGLSEGSELSQCALCHTDPDLIDELTEDAIMFGEDEPETSDLQQGNGYRVKQAPFDLYEKVLIDEAFLSTPHGQIPCQLCHLGNPDSTDPETAHSTMIADPSLNSEETCGQCHGDLTAAAINSLHMNPAPLYKTIEKRCTREQADKLKAEVLDKQCLSCHQGSCGSCHVSRPDVAGGGLRSGHLFQKKPDFVYQCLPCHTHPTGTDFIGKNGKGDVHYRKYQMTCSSCHSGQELHASAEGADSRYHFDKLPKCVDCHEPCKANAGSYRALNKSPTCGTDTIRCTCRISNYTD